MASYFFDSSALAKAYHRETGTEWVLDILAESGGRFYISSLTVVEMQSVFAQKVRDGKITADDYRLLCTRFGTDVSQGKLIVKNLLRGRQLTAEKLIGVHATQRRLRTLDALQLGVAAELKTKLSLSHFVCADRHLAAVASLEGLLVINPDEE